MEYRVIFYNTVDLFLYFSFDYSYIVAGFSGSWRQVSSSMRFLYCLTRLIYFLNGSTRYILFLGNLFCMIYVKFIQLKRFFLYHSFVSPSPPFTILLWIRKGLSWKKGGDVNFQLSENISFGSSFPLDRTIFIPSAENPVMEDSLKQGNLRGQ